MAVVMQKHEIVRGGVGGDKDVDRCRPAMLAPVRQRGLRPSCHRIRVGVGRHPGQPREIAGEVPVVDWTPRRRDSSSATGVQIATSSFSSSSFQRSGARALQCHALVSARYWATAWIAQPSHLSRARPNAAVATDAVHRAGGAQRGARLRRAHDRRFPRASACRESSVPVPPSHGR